MRKRNSRRTIKPNIKGEQNMIRSFFKYFFVCFFVFLLGGIFFNIVFYNGCVKSIENINKYNEACSQAIDELEICNYRTQFLQLYDSNIPIDFNEHKLILVKDNNFPDVYVRDIVSRTNIVQFTKDEKIVILPNSYFWNVRS